MKKDVFPETQNTWIGQRLREGKEGLAEINRHVMNVYAFPLRVYYHGTPHRWLGDADDVIQGYFADRLAREDFFKEWLKSGLRLRRWLINGFGFYLKELKKKRRREGRAQAMEEEPVASPVEVERAMDRAFTVSVIRQALLETRKVCEEKGLEKHWEVFHRHYYEGLPYRDFAADYRVDPVKAADMARTAAGKFKTALRELLAADGAIGGEIDEEIETLLEISGP